MSLARPLTTELEEQIKLYRVPILVALGMALRRASGDDRFLLTDPRKEDLTRNIVNIGRITRIQRQMTKGGLGVDTRQFDDMSGLLLFNGVPNLDDTQVVPVPSLSITGGRQDAEDVYLFATGTEGQKEEKIKRYGVLRPSQVQWRIRTPIMLALTTSILDYLAFRCNKLPFLHSVALKWSDRRWDNRTVPITTDLYRPEGEKTDMIVLPPNWMNEDMTVLDPNIWGRYETLMRANYEEYLGRRFDEYREDLLAFAECYQSYSLLVEDIETCNTVQEENLRTVGRLERRLTATLNRTLHIPMAYNLDTRDDTYRIKAWSPTDSEEATEDVFNFVDADGNVRWTSSFESNDLEQDGWFGDGLYGQTPDPATSDPYTTLPDGTELVGTKSLQIDQGFIARRMALPDGNFILSFWVKRLAGTGRVEIVRNTRMRTKRSLMDYITSRVESVDHFRESYETLATATIETDVDEWQQVWISFQAKDHFFVDSESYPSNEIFIVFGSNEEFVSLEETQFGSFRVDHMQFWFNDRGHNVRVINSATQTPFATLLREFQRTVNIEEIFPQNDPEFLDIESAAKYLKLDGENYAVIGEHRNAYNLHREGTCLNGWFKINAEDEARLEILQRRGLFYLFQKAGSFVPSYQCVVNSTKELVFTWYTAGLTDTDDGTRNISSTQYRNSLLLPQVGYESLEPYFNWQSGNDDLYKNLKQSYEETGAQPREWFSVPDNAESANEIIMLLDPSVVGQTGTVAPPPDDPQGVTYHYYRGVGTSNTVPDLDNEVPTFSGTTPNFDASPADQSNDYSFRWETWIDVPESGLYEFGLNTLDYSKMWVDDLLIIDRTTSSNVITEGSKFLAKGRHRIQVDYRQNSGSTRLLIYWKPPAAGSFVTIPDAELWQNDTPEIGRVFDNAGLTIYSEPFKKSDIGEGRYCVITADDPYFTEGGYLSPGDPMPPPDHNPDWAMGDVVYQFGGSFRTADGTFVTVGPGEAVTVWKYLEWHHRRGYEDYMPDPETLVLHGDPSAYLAETENGFVFTPVPINLRYTNLPQDYGFYSPSPLSWSPHFVDPTSPCLFGSPSPCSQLGPIEWPISPCAWGESPEAGRVAYSPWPTRWTPVGTIGLGATGGFVAVALKLGGTDQYIESGDINIDHLGAWGGEANITPMEGDVYENVPNGTEANLTWVSVPSDENAGYVFDTTILPDPPPSPLPSPLPEATNYYFYYVFVSDLQDLSIVVEHASGLKVWRDGLEVYGDATPTSPFNGVIRLGALPRGWYRFVIKNAGSPPELWFSMRFRTGDVSPFGGIGDGLSMFVDGSLIGNGSPIVDPIYGPAPSWRGASWDDFGVDLTVQNRSYAMFIQGRMEFDRWFNFNINASDHDVEVGIAGLIVSRTVAPAENPYTLNDLDRENSRDLWIGTQNPQATNTSSPISLYSFKVYQRRLPRREINSVQQQEGMNFNVYQWTLFGQYLDLDKDRVLDFYQDEATDLGMGVEPAVGLEFGYGPRPSDPRQLYGQSTFITSDPIQITPNGDRVWSVVADVLDDEYLEELVRVNSVGLSDALIYQDFYHPDQEGYHAFENRRWNEQRQCYEDQNLPYQPWLYGHIQDEWNSIKSVHDAIPTLAELTEGIEDFVPPVSPQEAHPHYGSEEDENLLTGVKGWFGFEDLMGYRDSLERLQREGIVFNYLMLEFRFRADRAELEAHLKDFAQSYDDLFFNLYEGNRLSR